MAPGGYISSTEGANNNSTDSFSNSARSRSKSRGYFCKSSRGPNCKGFTKIDAATTSHEAFAARTSDKCPSCSAPMVGTNPNRFPLRLASRHAARISSMVWQILMVFALSVLDSDAQDGAIHIIVVGRDRTGRALQ